MGPDLLDVVEGVVFLVEVDEPGEVPGVGGHDVVLALLGFSRDVASVGVVLDPQRRLQLDFIALLLKGTEGLQFKD